jgi:hypothetical protein
MRTKQGAEELHALQPDPLEPCADEVEPYIGALQGLAQSDADFVRRQA